MKIFLIETSKDGKTWEVPEGSMIEKTLSASREHLKYRLKKFPDTLVRVSEYKRVKTD